MSVETHNVTADDVLDGLPLASGQVTASSDGLSTTQIDRWIKRAAGRFNAILEGRSINPEKLDDYPNFRETIRAGIIAYAQARALEVRQYDGDRVQSREDEYNEIKSDVRSRARDLGQSIDGSSEVRSNVDTSDDKDDLKWGSSYRP